MAVLGGCSLLISMLIMSFYKSRTAWLITVSVAVVMFAIMVSVLESRASNQELLAARAAYTAVMVVYVGSAEN